jgi:glycosyltransferase involved in cell wall biosynthesis
MRKKLYANPTRIDPAIMTRILYIFSPCFRKLFAICFIIVKEWPKPKIKVFSEMSGNGKGCYNRPFFKCDPRWLALRLLFCNKRKKLLGRIGTKDKKENRVM